MSGNGTTMSLFYGAEQFRTINAHELLDADRMLTYGYCVLKSAHSQT